MSLTPEQKQVLETIRDEWGRAERDIKLAEQVCNEIVFPSINELRYGGRRVVDMVHVVLNGGSQDQISSLLADACFDCHRSRHDAIDTATAKIAITIEIMVAKLKHEAILAAFPDFTKLVEELGNVRDKISVSREKREDREAIYSSIEVTDFPALVKMYRSLQASEPMMRRLAKRNRWRDGLALWGVILSVSGIIFGIYAYFYPLSTAPQGPTVTMPITSGGAASTPSTGAKPGEALQPQR